MPGTNGTNGVKDEAQHGALKVIVVGAGIGGLSAAVFLRQQGHEVTLLEQSRFANELGAAVHLAPNSNGLLRRMGLYAEKYGANPLKFISQWDPEGSNVYDMDLAARENIWQHPWLLTHRVHLHNALKQFATSQDGLGKPANLQTSSKVAKVDIAKGTVTLESGEEFQGDVIIGADGVHSKTRSSLPGCDVKCFGSGKSAFRFLVQKSSIRDDPATAKFAERDGEMYMIVGQDRRIIMYPCQNNEILNFACIHPSAEYQVKEDGDDWNQQGRKSKLLEVFKSFEPAVLALLDKADSETLKVWELLDMDQLPSWTADRLALIGDAAHPFTPHQGQGAGQAMEDAASLAVVLPLGTPVKEIPERLKLYEKCRYERAHAIQEFSRLAGRDLGSDTPLDMNKYTMYNFGHDEWDHSINLFRKWDWARKPRLYWRMPVAFGPMPGPRQRFDGSYRDSTYSTFTTASLRFKTSATLLKNLFPTAAFSFASPGTFATASFSQTTLDKMEWLGGQGYKHFGLYIHDVQYTKKNGEVIRGTYLPLLYESLTDPIITGRDELGMPKIYCSIDTYRKASKYGIRAGWQGTQFCDMSLEGLQDSEVPSVPLAPGPNEGIMAYKYIPSVGHREDEARGQTDVEYAVWDPFSYAAKVTPSTLNRIQTSKKGSIKFDAKNWEALPTMHHIVDRLAEIPIYEVLESKVVEGTGVPDVSGARRIE